MNIKGTKKKNQVIKANVFEQQELLEKAEVIKSKRKASTWHELKANGKFDKNGYKFAFWGLKCLLPETTNNSPL